MKDDRATAGSPIPQHRLLRRDGPLYRQTADVLRDLILRGDLPVGSEFPKEARIADDLGVSLITVRRALRDLEDEGFIRKRSAKPAIVAASTPSARAGWRFGTFADLTDFTQGAELVISSYRREVAPAMQKHFGLGRYEPGFCLRACLVSSGQRKTQVTTYFPPDIGARLTAEDFTDQLIFRNVERCLGLKIDGCRTNVRAETADAAVARDLEVAVRSPILAVEMLYRTADGRNIEFTISRNPAELFSVTYDIAL